MRCAISQGVSRSMAAKACPTVARSRSVSLSRARSVKCRSQTTEMTGIVFQPFTAVQSELAIVSKTDNATQSFARVQYDPECEAAVNEQINIEYNISYVYHALYAYFARDNVSLPGFAAFFKDQSLEEREHAELLMDFQNKRGGRVKLQSITMPVMEFDHAEKGDALYAMELALSLEKLNFQKLRALHAVADKHEDAQMADFVEGALLNEQVDAIKEFAEYVAQLRRIGKGHAVWHFDRELAEAAKA